MERVLIVETNTKFYGIKKEATGLWLGECAEFVAAMKAAQIEVDYVSPKGGFVPLDPRSMKYMDAATRKLYDQDEFIERALINTLKPEEVDPLKYRAIYYTGGHGVMWDFPEDKRLQELALTIYENKGYLLSVCHGVAGLLNIKDKAGNYLIKDKEITGFTKTEEIMAGKTKVVPFYNADEARKRGAQFKQKRFYSEFALRDGRIITGQNPFSVKKVAKLFCEQL